MNFLYIKFLKQHFLKLWIIHNLIMFIYWWMSSWSYCFSSFWTFTKYLFGGLILILDSAFCNYYSFSIIDGFSLMIDSDAIIITSMEISQGTINQHDLSFIDCENLLAKRYLGKKRPIHVRKIRPATSHHLANFTQRPGIPNKWQEYKVKHYLHKRRWIPAGQRGASIREKVFEHFRKMGPG